MKALRVRIRNAREDDYGFVVARVDGWWGGRHMSDMLPRLFFRHFRDTSFVAVDGSRSGPIVGFLVGFVSQANPAEAYVHFIGVSPTHRNAGIARALYERFFTLARDKGCKLVRCVTAPVNTQSIAFHRHLGFVIEAGDSETGSGFSVHSDYDGPGQNRVCFLKELSSPAPKSVRGERDER